MKVAIVSLNLKWQAGGTRLIFAMADALKNIGHNVTIYATDFNGEAYPEVATRLNVVSIPTSLRLDWTTRPNGFLNKVRHKLEFLSAHKKISRSMADSIPADVDVLNLHDFAYKVGFYYRRKNPTARIIWNENDPPYSYLPKDEFLYDLASRIFNLTRNFFERKYLRAIDAAAVLDRFNERWCLTHGIKPYVIRSGVAFNEFYVPIRQIAANHPSIRILGIGALNKYRRFEDIIKAVHLLRQDGCDVKALIICKNIWHEDGYRDELIKLRDELILRDYVDLMFDGVDADGLRNAYRNSNVFVLPIYLPPPRNGYGWGLTNFEAMASGLPLVICNTSTATEVLRDGENALFVDPESPEQIAGKIKYLFSDPAIYDRVSSAGQDFVKKNVSWDKYAVELSRLFVRKTSA